jgi:hypothetical protein
MPKSKHRKSHQSKLEQYKTNKKIEQDAFKKKMIDNYMKLQQEALANREEHTSTEEVIGPDINIDELNMIDEWEPVAMESSDLVIDVDNSVIDPLNLDEKWNEIENNKNELGNSFNQPLDSKIEL